MCRFWIKPSNHNLWYSRIFDLRFKKSNIWGKTLSNFSKCRYRILEIKNHSGILNLMSTPWILIDPKVMIFCINLDATYYNLVSWLHCKYTPKYERGNWVYLGIAGVISLVFLGLCGFFRKYSWGLWFLSSRCQDCNGRAYLIE